MRKLSLFLAGLLTSLGIITGATVAIAQSGFGIQPANLWKRVSGAILPIVSTDTLGSSGTRVAKGWFTDPDTLAMSIGGTVTGNMEVSGYTSTTRIQTADGTAAAPSHTFTDDQNTGLYRVGADQLGISAGGSNIVTVSSTGLTATNVTSTGRIAAANGGFFSVSGDQLRSALSLVNSDVGVGDGPSIDFYWDGAFTQLGGKIGLYPQSSQSADLIFLTGNGAAPTEKMRIKNNGRLGIGITSPWTQIQSVGASQVTTPTLGSPNGAALGLSNTDGNYGIMFGVGNSGVGWIQQQRFDGGASSYDLLIQPSGSNVAIGLASASTRLDVGGTVSSTGMVSNGTVTTTKLVIGNGQYISKHLSSTASLDFGATAAGTCDLLTMTVTGAADGDTVYLGVPSALAASDNYQTIQSYVSAADTVTVKRCNLTNAVTALSDPAAATVRADVWKH